MIKFIVFFIAAFVSIKILAFMAIFALIPLAVLWSTWDKIQGAMDNDF